MHATQPVGDAKSVSDELRKCSALQDSQKLKAWTENWNKKISHCKSDEDSKSKIKELEKKDQQLKESANQCKILESKIEALNTELTQKDGKIQGKVKDEKEKLITCCKDCKLKVWNLIWLKSHRNSRTSSKTRAVLYREDDYRVLKMEYCIFRERTEQFNWEREEKFDMLMKDIQEHREAEKN
jgi:hypothetical protein